MQLSRQFLAVAFAAATVGSLVGAGAYGAFVAPDAATTGATTPTDATVGENASVSTFDSADDFRAYLREAERGGGGGYVPFDTVRRARPVVEEDGGATRDAERATPQATTTPMETSQDAASGDGERYSGTNVQETGIDEPDRLKTDGEYAYYAPGKRYRHVRDEPPADSATVLNLSDPAAPTVAGEVPDAGRMLLVNDTLVVFSRNRLKAYDVSTPSSPSLRWETPLNGSLVSARLYGGDLYLVTAVGVSVSSPCPVRPLGGDGPSVACTDIYHPDHPVAADVTYVTTTMDPRSGEVRDTVGFVGSSAATATYVSHNAVYLTYAKSAGRAEVLTEFLLQNQSDLLPESVRQEIRQVRSYDLSAQATSVEISAILEQWFAGMGEERRRTVRTRLGEAYREYLADHKRELQRTGVVKIGIGGGLAVESTGTVPGRPLNQFSLDEHDGHLRIATTVGSFGTESENDVYVLDENLDVVGSVTGMGENERIYSVRFVGDTGYVVTFRRIDPFHVVDLSNPTNPTLEGELKLPGFSTYLHPLGDDRILGIGEQNGSVKAVVFDVSNPENPRVLDDWVLDDSWSAVSESHHAFLQDEKHGVFFLPGSEGGYVFSYEDGLSLETTVSTEGPASRAMYVGNYLYVFGQSELVVVDETNWTRETSVDL